jgi:hypothetical protein
MVKGLIWTYWNNRPAGHPMKKAEGKKDPDKGKERSTPLRAIRLFCLECRGTWEGVRDCQNPGCRFYIYRFGTNPRRKGIGGNPRLRREGKNETVVFYQGEEVNPTQNDRGLLH